MLTTMATRCDRADLETRVRTDRATLRSARVLDDGSVVRDAILARADAVLVYPWGTEVATEEALSDPEYLSGLRGLTVTARHPASERVDQGRTDHVDVGTVLSARYDADDRAVVLELVIKDTEANNAIEEGQTGVSEGYTVPRMDATVTPARQLKRVPNHVALTLDSPPRMPGAHVRADGQEPTMTIEQVLAVLSARGLRTDAIEHISADLDALRTRADSIDERDAQLAAYADALPGDGGPKERVDAIVSGRVAELIALHRRADELGEEIDPALHLDAARKALAVALGGDAQRCDSADYAQAVIDMASVPDAATRFASTSTRADASDDAYGC